MELTPDFLISINGGENFPKERVLSIRTHDEAGIVFDSCEIELDNFDEALEFPNTKAKIEISLGYKENGLTKIGTYFVKEIFIDGARRVVKIKANAASKAMRSQKTKSNDGSMSDLANQVAGDMGFESAVSEDFDDVDLSEVTQFAESDMSLLTRLSQKNGAVAKPVDGHLVVNSESDGKSVSGKTLPTKYVEASEVANYSCSFKETESETGGGCGTIWANWFDKENGEYHLVHAGEGEPESELQEIFSSEKEALTAATAKSAHIIKKSKTFNFSTAGRPDLFAESPLELRDFPKIIPTKWIMARVEHDLSRDGFFTNVECGCFSTKSEEV